MKAVQAAVFGEADVLKKQGNVPIPSPADDEYLIRLKSAGVNPVDTYIRSGTFVFRPELPYIPGQDGAGVVEEVGKNVKRFKKGDRVAVCCSKFSGTYAEYCVVKEDFLCSLHESLSFSQGAALGTPYYTAYMAIFYKAFTKPGETVLVHGASGAVGIAAVQILKAIGCTVIGTAGTPEGIKLVNDQGADKVFNHREQGYMKTILEEFTEGKGVDVILEMLANVNLRVDMETAKSGGRIIIIGSRGEITIDPVIFLVRDLEVKGMILYAATDEQWKEMHAYMEAGQKAGWLKPHISKVYQMEAASQSHHDIIHSSGACGKLVIDIA